MFIPFPDGATTDLVIPDPERRNADPRYQTGNFSSATPTFAVVTTEGLSIPVGHLLGLYEFVATRAFPLFPDSFFPQ